jgi:hypothetical protein
MRSDGRRLQYVVIVFKDFAFDPFRPETSSILAILFFLSVDIIVMDLIKALPGNSSVSTVHHAVSAEQLWNNGVMQLVSKLRVGKQTSA